MTEMMKVKAYRSQCIGIVITGLHYYGEIVKINKKSIRVHFNRFVKTFGEKVEKDMAYDNTQTFKYWKTIVASYGENKGKTVDLYKNSIYGYIEIAK